MIEREENVMPIVPAGNSLGDMILGEEDNVYGKKDGSACWQRMR